MKEIPKEKSPAKQKEWLEEQRRKAKMWCTITLIIMITLIIWAIYYGFNIITR